MATIKKAQTGIKATKDSTAYFSNKATDLISNTIRKDKNSAIRNGSKNAMTDPTVKQDYKDLSSANENRDRQKLKGKPGHDANGFPKKKNGGSVAKDGKWMQKAAASIKKRGTAGKCTPITKPGCTGKAKTLAKTFKKIAKSNKKK